MDGVNILILKMNTYFFHEGGGVQAFTYSFFDSIIEKKFVIDDTAFVILFVNRFIRHCFGLSEFCIMGCHDRYGFALQ